jgi:hypothetical protein
LVKRKTRRDRLLAKLRLIKQELRQFMHQPLPTVGKWLGHVVRGYFNYHAVPTNIRALVRFRDGIVERWLRVLRRRSQRGSRLTWDQMVKIADEWLPRPRITHPWPRQRFNVTHPR